MNCDPFTKTLSPNSSSYDLTELPSGDTRASFRVSTTAPLPIVWRDITHERPPPSPTALERQYKIESHLAYCNHNEAARADAVVQAAARRCGLLPSSAPFVEVTWTRQRTAPAASPSKHVLKHAPLSEGTLPGSSTRAHTTSDPASTASQEAAVPGASPFQGVGSKEQKAAPSRKGARPASSRKNQSASSWESPPAETAIQEGAFPSLETMKSCTTATASLEASDPVLFAKIQKLQGLLRKHVGETDFAFEEHLERLNAEGKTKPMGCFLKAYLYGLLSQTAEKYYQKVPFTFPNTLQKQLKKTLPKGCFLSPSPQSPTWEESIPLYFFNDLTARLTLDARDYKRGPQHQAYNDGLRNNYLKNFFVPAIEAYYLGTQFRTFLNQRGCFQRQGKQRLSEEAFLELLSF